MASRVEPGPGLYHPATGGVNLMAKDRRPLGGEPNGSPFRLSPSHPVRLTLSARLFGREDFGMETLDLGLSPGNRTGLRVPAPPGRGQEPAVLIDLYLTLLPATGWERGAHEDAQAPPRGADFGVAIKVLDPTRRVRRQVAVRVEHVIKIDPDEIVIVGQDDSQSRVAAPILNSRHSARSVVYSPRQLISCFSQSPWTCPRPGAFHLSSIFPS